MSSSEDEKDRYKPSRPRRPSLIESRQPRRQRARPRNAATGASRRSGVAEEKQLSFLEPDANVELGTALTAGVPRPAARLLASDKIDHEHIAAIAMPAAAPPYGEHPDTRPKGARLAASSLHDRASRVTAGLQLRSERSKWAMTGLAPHLLRATPGLHSAGVLGRRFVLRRRSAWAAESSPGRRESDTPSHRLFE